MSIQQFVFIYVCIYLNSNQQFSLTLPVKSILFLWVSQLITWFQLQPLTPDEAAAKAIHLFSQDAQLCERHPNKIARKQGNVINSKKSDSSVDDCVSNDHIPTNDILISENSENSKNNIKYHCGKYVLFFSYECVKIFYLNMLEWNGMWKM